MDRDPRELEALAGRLLRELFPICRSITGQGVRQTLGLLARHAPLRIIEYPSGTACHDWTIPPEWNIKDAYIKDAAGRRLVDFQRSNLHVVSYSEPIHQTMGFAELEPHLHTLPRLPRAIPYRTSYYRRDWGFCLSHERFLALDRRATYEVRIDSELKDGALSLAEARLPGASGREYLFSTYCCHPSLANDNLSGVVLNTLLCRALAGRRLHHSYRFLWLPETIGAIAYLARHEREMRALAGGFVVTTVGGPGEFGYQETFLGDHQIDRAARQAFRELGLGHTAYRFAPNGSDERQYSSPGYRIPMGTICKDKYFEYEQYHTSLDDLEFVTAGQLGQTLEVYLTVVEILEADRRYLSLRPYGEPQLGRRGLYPSLGGSQVPPTARDPGAWTGQAPPAPADPVDAMLWFLFLADGRHSLLDMAGRSGVPFFQLAGVAGELARAGLVEEVDEP